LIGKRNHFFLERLRISCMNIRARGGVWKCELKCNGERGYWLCRGGPLAETFEGNCFCGNFRRWLGGGKGPFSLQSKIGAGEGFQGTVRSCSGGETSVFAGDGNFCRRSEKKKSFQLGRRETGRSRRKEGAGFGSSWSREKRGGKKNRRKGGILRIFSSAPAVRNFESERTDWPWGGKVVSGGEGRVFFCTKGRIVPSKTRVQR